MKILKKLLVTSCILVSTLTQTAWMKNFDYDTFYSYVDKAQTKINEVHDQVQFEEHGNKEILWTGQSCADALYPKQKAALKLILEEIKIDPKDNDGTIPISQLFKHEAYNSWKQTFKNNYETSTKNNDVFAWAWLHKPVSIAIHE